MVLSIETKVVANAVFLLIALALALLIARLSLTYRRSIGDGELQHRQSLTIVRVVLLLSAVTIAATAFNLFTA